MSDRLEFPTRAAALAAANRIHAQMIAADPDYARSVAEGRTTAWAVPYQDRDAAGNVIPGSPWCVNIKQRGRKAATPDDIARLKPIKR